jgi:hypothetical protein
VSILIRDREEEGEVRIDRSIIIKVTFLILGGIKKTKNKQQKTKI